MLRRNKPSAKFEKRKKYLMQLAGQSELTLRDDYKVPPRRFAELQADLLRKEIVKFVLNSSDYTPADTIKACIQDTKHFSITVNRYLSAKVPSYDQGLLVLGLMGVSPVAIMALQDIARDKTLSQLAKEYPEYGSKGLFTYVHYNRYDQPESVAPTGANRFGKPKVNIEELSVASGGASSFIDDDDDLV